MGSRRLIRRGLFALFAAALLLTSSGSSGASAPAEQGPFAGHKLRTPSSRIQSAAGPAAAVVPVWEAFVQRLAEPPAVSWNAVSGAPEALFGRLSEAAAEVSEARARRFLDANAALFRLSAG